MVSEPRCRPRSRAIAASCASIGRVVDQLEAFAAYAEGQLANPETTTCVGTTCMGTTGWALKPPDAGSGPRRVTRRTYFRTRKTLVHVPISSNPSIAWRRRRR